jgi:membrane protein DedA with SNARE-associated domain
MHEMMSLLAQHGLVFIFINVFLVQAGVPVPAVPALMVAGAFTVTGAMSLPAIIAVAVIASLLGDLIWYAIGRTHGMRVLQWLCRISISPDSCVRSTEDRFLRWGAPSLMAAKFIPGFATVAPPLAGALRVGLVPFLVYSAISAALWAGLAAGAGRVFSSQVEWLLAELTRMGGHAVMLVAALLLLFIAYKWWQRRRFFKVLRMARITVTDLYRMMTDGHQPVVVDVRSAGARELDPRSIPGAVAVDIERFDDITSRLPPDRDIIVYCT